MTAPEAPVMPPRREGSRRGRLIAGVVVLSLMMVGAGVGIGAAIWSGKKSKTVAVASTPAPVSNAAPGTQGHWRSRSIQFLSTGRVDITRKWDAYNNCVEEDGSEYRDSRVTAGQEVTLGFTTVSSGTCFFESSRMHWQVTRLDDSGKPTRDTADVSINQSGFPRVLDYTPHCEGRTGSMKCELGGILGDNLKLTF